MRTALVFVLGLALLGCDSRMGKGRGAMLTAQEAGRISHQLANEQGSALYRCDGFASGRAARFADGRWVWTERQGYGRGDLEVTVELAADGSTNRVAFKILANTQVL